MLPGATATSEPVVRSAARVDSISERWFYARMAYACAAIALVGFTPTYWAPLATGRFPGPALLHFHGWLSTAWMLLFILQARAAAAYRFDRHRALGLAGISVATAVFLTGFMVAVHAINRGAAAGLGVEAQAFAIVPLSIIVMFAAAVGAAIATVRRSDVHMRLMLVATITMLPPAIARVLLLLVAGRSGVNPTEGGFPTVGFALVPSIASDLLLAAAMVHDWRMRGRPHPVYVIAGSVMLAVQIGRIPLSATGVWHAFTTWLVGFAG
jgi:hypothetical protein